MLKFGFSEKATKFEKIFVVLLTRALCSVRATAYLSKSRRRYFKTNVDKSYYTNFKMMKQVNAIDVKLKVMSYIIDIKLKILIYIYTFNVF